MSIFMLFLYSIIITNMSTVKIYKQISLRQNRSQYYYESTQLIMLYMTSNYLFYKF